MAKGRGRSIFWTVICTIVLLGAAALGINAYRQSTCEHEYGEGKVVKEATCTEDGEIEYECDKCWKVKTENIKATGHKVLQLDAVRATCTSTGLHAGEMCEVCEKVLVKQEVIPILAHDLEKVEGKESTCTERGYFEYEACKDCDYTTEIVYRPFEHEYVTVAAQAATCTEIGWNEYQECTICTHRNGYVEISRTGHTDENGDSVCDVCDKAIAITDTMVEVAAEVGEFVAGNWYRFYFTKEMLDEGVSIQAPKLILSSAEMSDPDNNYNGVCVTYGDWLNAVSSNPNDTTYNVLDGLGAPGYIAALPMNVTETYADIYFAEGVYTCETNSENTVTITIDETTTIKSFKGGQVFRLEGGEEVETLSLRDSYSALETSFPMETNEVDESIWTENY